MPALMPAARVPSAKEALGVRLIGGHLTSWDLELYANALGATAPGNCWTPEEAERRQAAARAAGVPCYIRCWHGGEVGYFVIRESDYSRVLPFDDALINRERFDACNRDQVRSVLEGTLGRSVSQAEFAERYARAWIEYDTTLRSEAERAAGRRFSDEQWGAERKRSMTYQPGHPKSSLFARLLAGEAPLPYAPPCAYSYPWYEAFEPGKDHPAGQVAFAGERGTAMTLGAHADAARDVDPSLPIVQISGAIWNIVGRDGSAHIVSYGQWRDAGWRWRLECVDQPAKLQAFNSTTIRTGAELRAECTRRIQQVQDNMRALAGGQSLTQASLTNDRTLTADSVTAHVASGYLLKCASNLLAERRRQGLSTELTDQEFQTLVDSEYQQALFPDFCHGGLYRVRDDDVIVRREWQLRCLGRQEEPALRVAPSASVVPRAPTI